MGIQLFLPPPKKRGDRTPILTHVYCGQTVPGHIVLDRDPSPRIFGPCLLWPNGWMDQDATWYGGHIVLDGDPGPPRKGHRSPPLSAHVYCGQMVAHLSYC